MELINLAELLKQGYNILNHTNSDITFFETIMNADYFAKVRYITDKIRFDIDNLIVDSIDNNLLFNDNSKDFWKTIFISKEELSNYSLYQKEKENLNALISDNVIQQISALKDNKLKLRSITVDITDLEDMTILNFKKLSELGAKIGETINVDLVNQSINIGLNGTKITSPYGSLEVNISNYKTSTSITHRKINADFDDRILNLYVDKTGKLDETLYVNDDVLTNVVRFKDIEHTELKHYNDYISLVPVEKQEFEPINIAIEEVSVNEIEVSTNIILTKENIPLAINKFLQSYI